MKQCVTDLILACAGKTLQAIALSSAMAGMTLADYAPNQPRFSEQWALQSYAHGAGTANFIDAWRSLPADSRHQEIVVAVVDSGVLPHSSFIRALLPGYDFISDPMLSNDGDGRDSDPSDTGNWIDEYVLKTESLPPSCQTQRSVWHGTEVTSIIAANHGDGQGIAGAAPQVRILPVRVLGRCGGRLQDWIDGLRWAVGLPVAGVPANPHPAHIINLSLGSPGYCSAAEQAAIDAAVAMGALVVVASGNGGSDFVGDDLAREPMSPASCRNTFVVGANTRWGSVARYGNYGRHLSLLAPGGSAGISSIWTATDGGTREALFDNNYHRTIGTSLAAPYASAAAALVMMANPDLRATEVAHLLRVTSREHVDHEHPCVQQQMCGSGLLDAARAVNLAKQLRRSNPPSSAPTLSAAQRPGASSAMTSQELATGASVQNSGSGASNALLLALLPLTRIIANRARRK